MDAIHIHGATCDYCFKSIGSPDSEIDTIYRLESELFPGEQVKLCQKDLKDYYERVKIEREEIQKAVKEWGTAALTPRQKTIYKRLQ